MYVHYPAVCPGKLRVGSQPKVNIAILYATSAGTARRPLQPRSALKVPAPCHACIHDRSSHTVGRHGHAVVALVAGEVPQAVHPFLQRGRPQPAGGDARAPAGGGELCRADHRLQQRPPLSRARGGDARSCRAAGDHPGADRAQHGARGRGRRAVRSAPERGCRAGGHAVRPRCRRRDRLRREHQAGGDDRGNGAARAVRDHAVGAAHRLRLRAEGRGPRRRRRRLCGRRLCREARSRPAPSSISPPAATSGTAAFSC